MSSPLIDDHNDSSISNDLARLSINNRESILSPVSTIFSYAPEEVEELSEANPQLTREIIFPPNCPYGDLDQCGICREPFSNPVQIIPCLHIADLDCMKSWLHESDECPFCRTLAIEIHYDFTTTQGQYKIMSAPYLEFLDGDTSWVELVTSITTPEDRRNLWEEEWIARNQRVLSEEFGPDFDWRSNHAVQERISMFNLYLDRLVEVVLGFGVAGGVL